MRWWIGGVTVLFSLACGGMMGEEVEERVSPPRALDCPEGTELRGGVYPMGRDLWAGWPMLALDPADEGGFRPADEAVEVLIATDMSDTDSMWWCADAAMTPRGPFLQQMAYGDYTLWLSGTLNGSQRQGELRAEWVEDGRVVGPALKGAYLDGLPHGEWWWGAEPHEPFEALATGSYLKGLPDGNWTWEAEGKRASATYLNGVLQGEWMQTWDTSEQTGQFKDGARDGEWRVVTDGELVSSDTQGEVVEATPRPRPSPRPQPRPRPRTRTR